jgi:hypothetical protein
VTLKCIFPEYDESKGPWVSGMEAFFEITMFLLISSRISDALSQGTIGYGFAAVPYGTLLGIFLLDNAYQKLLFLQSSLISNFYERRSSNGRYSIGDDSTDTDEEDD